MNHIKRKNDVKVSIVTVVFNEADLLNKTIDNIRTLKSRLCEYIIIDGGSTDETVEIIKNNQDVIDFWISEEDDGLYDAMNKGIHNSCGEWIVFMNAGDLFSSSTVLNEVFPYLGSSEDIVYGDRFYKHRSGEEFIQVGKSINTIFERMPFCHQSTFVKRKILINHGFNVTYRYAADYELFIRLYKLGYKYLHIDIPVCIFESGGKSESGLRPHIEAIKVVLDNCSDKNTLKKNVYLKSFKEVCSSMIDEYLN